jgi:chromosome segregation ATPase
VPLGVAPGAGDVGDVAFDARLLAEYGEAPKHWLLSPIYAWRVLRRQRELKKALVGRREEVKRALTEADDARVAFAERIRHDAEKPEERYKPFVPVLEQLRAAEELLRSRDRILASEQDAQSARLASVDARLARLEAELAQAQAAERAVAGELASAQAALARSEQKLKRAEAELRSAQRETDGSRS